MECQCELCRTEREGKRRITRAHRLNLCATWMDELGFSQEAEFIRRIRANQGLAKLWVAIYTGERKGEPFVDAFLVESPDKPSEYAVLEYILGRAPDEDDGILTVTGPFIWPDPDDEPVITTTGRKHERDEMAEERKEAQEAPLRYAHKREECVSSPGTEGTP